MQRKVVIDVVGLTQRMISPELMPQVSSWAKDQAQQSFAPEFPAVTTTAQSTYLTGVTPADHGIVANGWYNREAAEVQFWKQSNHLVKAPKVWETAKANHPDFTCAKLFWWYNMYSSADFTMTPRPMYPADGSKVFDIYTQPMGLRESVKSTLGDFPFMNFWGPKSGLPSSQWIADAAQWTEAQYKPTLNLVYLPHLDYTHQSHGPNSPEGIQAIKEIDQVLGELIDFYTKRNVEIVLLSEYGISEVDTPIHINRLFREKGWITIKKELGLELLDCGASQAFAVADHQVAHVYINNPAILDEVKDCLSNVSDIEFVVDNHELYGTNTTGSRRAGDLVVTAKEKAWFTYYYWEEDQPQLAPDFARCIDIHRKPGYDPCELFIDPELKFPLLKIATFLAKKKLGFRGLMDVIPLDATLVKGSHGRPNVNATEQPVIIGGNTTVKTPYDVHNLILEHYR